MEKNKSTCRKIDSNHVFRMCRNKFLVSCFNVYLSVWTEIAEEQWKNPVFSIVLWISTMQRGIEACFYV